MPVQLITGVNTKTDWSLIPVSERPCRCGQPHFGDYAEEDWQHHQCFHSGTLLHLGHGQLCCEDCGENFSAEDVSLPGEAMPRGD